jgi:hypothetical protein
MGVQVHAMRGCPSPSCPPRWSGPLRTPRTTAAHGAEPQSAIRSGHPGTCPALFSSSRRSMFVLASPTLRRPCLIDSGQIAPHSPCLTIHLNSEISIGTYSYIIIFTLRCVRCRDKMCRLRLPQPVYDGLTLRLRLRLIGKSMRRELAP